MIVVGGVAERSAKVEQVDDEDQGLPRRDRSTSAAVAVAEVGRDDQLAAPADLHALHAAVPAGDDVARTEPERERLAAVPGGVELLTGRERDADVVHDCGVARRGLLAGAIGDVGDLELTGRLAVREVDFRLLVSAHQAASFAGPCMARMSMATATLSFLGSPPCCAGRRSSTRLPTGTPASSSNGVAWPSIPMPKPRGTPVSQVESSGSPA